MRAVCTLPRTTSVSFGSRCCVLQLPCLTGALSNTLASYTRSYNTPHETRHYDYLLAILTHLTRHHHQAACALPVLRSTLPPPSHRHPRAIPVLAHARAIPVLAHALRTPLLARAEVMRLDLRRAHCHAPPSPSLLPSHFGETRCGLIAR